MVESNFNHIPYNSTIMAYRHAFEYIPDDDLVDRAWLPEPPPDDTESSILGARMEWIPECELLKSKPLKTE